MAFGNYTVDKNGKVVSKTPTGTSTPITPKVPVPKVPVVPKPTPGSNTGYSPANVQKAYDQLIDLKSQVQAGKLKMTDYQNQVSKLVQTAQTNVQNIAGTGSSGASSVNPIWQKIQDAGFVKADAGKWIPLS